MQPLQAMDPSERARLPRESLEELLEALYENAVADEGRPSLLLSEWLRYAEAWRIRLALRLSRGDKSAASRSLGLPRRSLYHRMALLGLHEPSQRGRREEPPQA